MAQIFEAIVKEITFLTEHASHHCCECEPDWCPYHYKPKLCNLHLLITNDDTNEKNI